MTLFGIPLAELAVSIIFANMALCVLVLAAAILRGDV